MESVCSAVLGFFRIYGAKILWIIFLFFFGRIILGKIMRGVAKMALRMSDTDKERTEKRLKTLQRTMVMAGNLVITLVVLLMLLDLFGVDIMPILTGVGIVGLAVGFGAKTLVQDAIAGFFILAENQYDIGDVVRIDKFEGAVRQITMRSTVLCDKDGNVVYIPNGSIKSVVNCSQKRACTVRKRTDKSKIRSQNAK